MSEALARLEVDDLQESLREIQALIADPARSAELHAKLDALHPADVAYLLEALPLEERLAVWDLVKAGRDGEILLEVSEAVRESLIASMDSAELVAAAETLEADELADIAADLPAGVMEEVVHAVREDVTLEAATRYLRRMDELPDHTDQLFVVDRAQRLKGTLPLARLIVSDLEHEVAKVMMAESVRFYPQDSAEDAASAFERYDLVSAPVVDAADMLIGRLTVNAVVDHIRERSAESRLAEAGLRQEEDVFATVLD
ncbi:MAG: magnesium transporter, partial [Betaproteobacteria bacterium]